MINGRVICKVLAKLLFLEAFLLLISWGVGILYHENVHAVYGFPMLIAVGLGGLLRLIGLRSDNQVNRRDGYVIVLLTWLSFSLIGMLPFIFGHYVNCGVVDACFEAISGFTTTGATILTNIDTLPRSILFWRSLTHWIGGLGIVIFTIAFLPSLGSNNLKLFTAESTGMSQDRIHPRVSTTARWLWMVYLMLTAACTLSLWIAGMSFFDAINHAFSTLATGGFSTHQDSILYFKSPLIEYILIVFMFLGSINFTLFYLSLFKRQWKDLFRDEELRFYACLLGGVTLIITLILIFVQGQAVEMAFRHTLFTLLSFESTTGFITCDYMLWPPMVWILMLLLMAVGGCAGSTAGGLKCVRLLSFYKILQSEFKIMLHPKAVVPPCVNHTPLPLPVIQRLLAFVFAYMVIILVGTFFIASQGVPLLDALSIAMSTFSNAGPTVGHELGAYDSMAVLPDSVKWACCGIMLLGRLEIFSLILPLTPAFWRKD